MVNAGPIYTRKNWPRATERTQAIKSYSPVPLGSYSTFSNPFPPL